MGRNVVEVCLKKENIKMKKLVMFGVSVLFSQMVVAQEAVELYHTPVEKRDIADLDLGGISVGALLEVEAFAGSESGEDVSDITLATFEFSIEADLNDWISARAILLWEEDDTEPIDLDEGVISFGGTDDIPWSLELGEMYLPFGGFHSHFVSDPLTLELGETRESAAIFGYDRGLFNLRFGLLNGSVDEDGNDDQADDLMVAVTLTPCDGIEIGGYWLSDLGESNGLEEGLLEAIDGSEDFPGVAYGSVGGAGGFIHFELGDTIFESEYISAVDSFDAGLLGDDKLKPQAWNVEIAYAISESVELAAKYEGTEDFPDMPEEQYGVAGSYAFMESTTLSFEYLHGIFESDTKDRDIVTAQVAVEF